MVAKKNLDKDIAVSYVPEKVKWYIPGNKEEKTLEKIISSREFIPTYIYGETGLGKSMSVLQCCAKKKIEVLRLNVNVHTDEEDFVGGLRLIGGETVFEYGPLVIAMQRGAILLIDEITALSPNNAYALFSALDSQEVYIKKTNEKIVAKPGFNIIVTDNTRGEGGHRYVGSNIQNLAFMDRFLVYLKYSLPTPTHELKILNAVPDSNTTEDQNKKLIVWANIVRRSYSDGIIGETISVRKLVSILTINKAINNLQESIRLTLQRFDQNDAHAIMSLYDKIVDPGQEFNFDADSLQSMDVLNVQPV